MRLHKYIVTYRIQKSNNSSGIERQARIQALNRIDAYNKLCQLIPGAYMPSAYLIK